MRSRLASILALAWVLLWFGVVMPGHERGAVRLPGFATAITMDASVEGALPLTRPCPLCPLQNSSEGQDGPAPLPGGCCAICQLIATLSTPPIHVFDPGFSTLLTVLSVDQPELHLPRARLHLPPGRGPPLA